MKWEGIGAVEGAVVLKISEHCGFLFALTRKMIYQAVRVGFWAAAACREAKGARGA